MSTGGTGAGLGPMAQALAAKAGSLPGGLEGVMANNAMNVGGTPFTNPGTAQLAELFASTGSLPPSTDQLAELIGPTDMSSLNTPFTLGMAPGNSMPMPEAAAGGMENAAEQSMRRLLMMQALKPPTIPQRTISAPAAPGTGTVRPGTAVANLYKTPTREREPGGGY